MEPHQKHVRYSATNTYLTLNELTPETRNVWIVFHGIGYLSRFFIPFFDELDPSNNYIIAPQAPSKYYLDQKYKYVGASWLTRESLVLEIDNVLQYVEEVLRAEAIPSHCRLYVLGFSQGVSIATRWLARSRTVCEHLILYAGGIPKELKKGDFDFLPEKTRITFVAGRQDEFLTADRMKTVQKALTNLFNGRAEIRWFEGGHELKKSLIQQLE